MSNKSKNSDIAACKKYVHSLLRAEKPVRRPQAYSEKVGVITKLATPVSPPVKQVRTIISPVNTQRNPPRAESPKAVPSTEREPWALLLRQKQSKTKFSSFSNFDPLRTLHFLSKELQIKLNNAVPTGTSEAHQILGEMKHALQRIPPDVASLIHSQTKLSENDEGSVPKMSKEVQTPPTLYKEDTEIFKRIMDENTQKLEVSCRNLEALYTNLQAEKDLTEKELERCKNDVTSLYNRIKELEVEMAETENPKLYELIQQKQYLETELANTKAQLPNAPTIRQLKKLVDDLRHLKNESDKKCAKLDYDLAVLTMEKEKLAATIVLKDQEIDEMRTEMLKIGDQVNREWIKLNTETLSKVADLKSGSQVSQDSCGDALALPNDERVTDLINKEVPSGDFASGILRTSDNIDKVAKGFTERGPLTIQEEENNLENLLMGLTPSCKALMSNVQNY